MNFNKGRASIILLRGGGDLASGVALRAAPGGISSTGDRTGRTVSSQAKGCFCPGSV